MRRFGGQVYEFLGGDTTQSAAMTVSNIVFLRVTFLGL
jgi:hypothetical protein